MQVEVSCGLSMTEGRIELQIDGQTAVVMQMMKGKTSSWNKFLQTLPLFYIGRSQLIDFRNFIRPLQYKLCYMALIIFGKTWSLMCADCTTTADWIAGYDICHERGRQHVPRQHSWWIRVKPLLLYTGIHVRRKKSEKEAKENVQVITVVTIWDCHPKFL